MDSLSKFNWCEQTFSGYPCKKCYTHYIIKSDGVDKNFKNHVNSWKPSNESENKLLKDSYCTYHKSKTCFCTRDKEGYVMHHTGYPIEKYCKKHNTLLCDCPRHKDGDMIKKGIRDGKHYCNYHRTWWCKCYRDKHGHVMSSYEGYPIERYCSIHNETTCACKRDITGKVVNLIPSNKK
jgi:hypothetical protein